MAAPRITVFTIASNNYLAYVRVLMNSVRAAHPEARLCLCLADRPVSGFDASQEVFEVVPADSIGIPTFDDMVVRYDIMEFNTAVKPYMIRWLFDHSDTDLVIYLDPDIRVYGRLDPVTDCFARGASMVLTPHITQPLEDGRTPNDHHMLQAGTFNLGFIGVRRCDEALRFVDWWARRLATQAVSDIGNNLFTDQRWCDLAPSFVDALAVLKDPGCNVAYWNLAHRNVARDAAGRWTVDRGPLTFFHFSGVNVARRQLVSKHQDRFTWDNAATLRPLFDAYLDALVDAGIETTRGWGYAYADVGGVALTPLLRLFYRHLYPEVAPRAAQADASLWLRRATETEPGMPEDEPGRVTRLMHFVHSLRPDLQAAFALATAHGRDQFCRWFVHASSAEYGLPAALVPAVAAMPVEAPPPATPRPAPAAALQAGPLGDLWHRLPPVARRQLAPAWQAALRLAPAAPAASLQPAADPPDGALVTPLMHIVWKARSDLQAAFDLTTGAGTRQFVDWFRVGAIQDYGPHMRSENALPRPIGTAGPAGEPGANLVGYARAEIGMGEHVRMTAAALAPTGVPFSVINVQGRAAGRQQADPGAVRLVEAAQHRANLIHVNADQMLALYGQQGPALFDGRYNIGYWAWELARWPEAWTAILDLVHEVWAPSQFIFDAVAAVARVPVRRMPLCVTLPPPDPRLDRAHFGLNPSAFHFLYTFDFQSYVDRKNPRAAIAAFRQAFPRGAKDVRLVLKTMNGEPGHPGWRALVEDIGDDSRITLMDRTLSRAEVIALCQVCDAFVSLHRSEGFGRGPAEAMYLGKPVIVTGYSGNLDFTRPDTAALVEHRLIPVEPGQYPMHEGQVWADPDVGHAAWHMRRLVDHPADAVALGRAGRTFIHDHFSPRAVGMQYAARLRELGLAP